MMRILRLSFYLSLLLISLMSFSIAESKGASIYKISIDGSINPATDDFLKTAIKEAEAAKAKLFILTLNTPGGLLTSTQTMVESIFKSEIPVVVYVSPTGASATSAGVFLTLAAHYAVMAPGTTIGAAHPVSGAGQNVEGDMREKIENYAASQIKAIAEQRKRNVAWAEDAVRKSVSITDSEAVKEKVVDFIAKDLAELLAMLEGKEIEKEEGRKILLSDLRLAQIVEFEMSFKQKLVNVLSDPNIAMLLGLAAMLGLGIEFYNPGLLFPGIVGVICLVLSLTATQVLPINYGGVALLVLAAIFFIAEFMLPSFGLWGGAGLICLVLGAIYAIDTDQVWSSSGFGVDKVMIGSVAAIVGAVLILISILSLRTLKLKVSTGKEGLIGKTATVKSEFKLSNDKTKFVGKVLLMGELWRAEVAANNKQLPKPGDELSVLGLSDGLTLILE